MRLNSHAINYVSTSELMILISIYIPLYMIYLLNKYYKIRVQRVNLKVKAFSASHPTGRTGKLYKRCTNKRLSVSSHLLIIILLYSGETLIGFKRKTDRCLHSFFIYCNIGIYYLHF